MERGGGVRSAAACGVRAAAQLSFFPGSRLVKRLLAVIQNEP